MASRRRRLVQQSHVIVATLVNNNHGTSKRMLSNPREQLSQGVVRVPEVHYGFTPRRVAASLESQARLPDAWMTRQVRMGERALRVQEALDLVLEIVSCRRGLERDLVLLTCRPLDDR